MTARSVYDGAGVTDYDTIINSELTRNTDFEIDVLNLELYKDFPVVNGDELTYYDEDLNIIFKGIVKTISPGKGTKQLIVYSFEQELQETIVEDTFTNISPESLIETIVTTYSTLTFSTSISTGVTIAEYTSKNKTAWEIISDIMERMPGVTYYVNTSKVFTLFTKGSITASISLTNYSNCIIEEEWQQDTSNQTTSLKLVGNKQVTPKTELFSGTGSQTEFTLAEIPVDMKVSVGGTEQTLERENTASGDYTYSKDQKKIIFNSAPASGTNNIEVVYNFELNLKIEMDAAPSIISTYGIIENKITKKFLNTYDELNEYATEYLDIYGNPLYSNSAFLTQTLDAQDLIPGYQIKVYDAENLINEAIVDKFFLINSVKRNMPDEGVTIELGDRNIGVIDFLKEVKTNLDQVKEEDDNATIAMKSQNLTNTAIIEYDADITAITKRTFDSDTWYWSETSTSRNQWKEDGTGPVFRESSGFTDTDVDGLEEERVSEGGTEERVTEGGSEIRTTEGFATPLVTEGVVTNTFMISGLTGWITQLDTIATHVAVGDDNTTPVVGDTALGNETYIEARFRAFANSNSFIIDLRLDTTENNGNTIAEHGVFDAASGGNLISRDLTTAFNKTASNESFYRNTYNLTVTNTNLN